MELTINQALLQAIDFHKEGKLQDAERLYKAILKSQPQHPDANHNLGVLAVSFKKVEVALPLFKTALEANPKVEQFWLSYIGALINDQQNDLAKKVIEQAKNQGLVEEKLNIFKTQLGLIKDSSGSNPPQQQINNLLELYQTKKYDEAEKLALSLTEKFPNHPFAYKVLGAALKQMGKINEALIPMQKSVQLSPQDAEAHNNLGVTFKELGRLNESEASFRKVIALKPDDAEAHNNLGTTLIDLNKFEEAEESYKRATKLKPKYLGAQYNLIQLLNVYSSQKESSHPIIKVDQEIKKIDLIEKTSGIISDDKITQLFNKSISIIEKYNLELQINDSQIYRRNSVDLNCKRHKQIFNKFNIIPEFCFGCFKVQIEPKSLLDLIKLFLVFNQIKFAKNNTRKCMIESRSETSGFYKGLIYCSSVTEAYHIADHLEKIINVNISPGLLVSVKRGCSEYPVSFPDFKKVNRSGVKLMNYDESWKLIEKDHDSKILNRPRIVKPSLSYLNLSDVLIIRNWIDYAKGIGDPSVEFLNHQTVSSQKYYNIAKTRLETYTFPDTHT